MEITWQSKDDATINITKPFKKKLNSVTLFNSNKCITKMNNLIEQILKSLIVI